MAAHAYLDAVCACLTRAAEQLPSQQVAIVLQEGQVEVPEELHVLVLHAELLGRVPVDHLEGRTVKQEAGSAELGRRSESGTFRSDTSV